MLRGELLVPNGRNYTINMLLNLSMGGFLDSAYIKMWMLQPGLKPVTAHSVAEPLILYSRCTMNLYLQSSPIIMVAVITNTYE